MFRLGAVLFVLVGISLAAEFKQARVLDFHDDSTVAGGTVSGPASNGVPVTPPTRVTSSILKCEIVLALDGETYTALFPEDSHFQIADLTRGGLLPVRIEGKKITMQRPSDGKELKGKILKIVRDPDGDTAVKK